MRYVFTDGVNKDGVRAVYCVSHFAGNAVRGVAKCDPTDTFNHEDGMKLAQLRCDEKVSIKRIKRAREKLREACDDLARAQARVAKMQSYYEDSLREGINVRVELDEFEAKFH